MTRIAIARLEKVVWWSYHRWEIWLTSSRMSTAAHLLRQTEELRRYEQLEAADEIAECRRAIAELQASVDDLSDLLDDVWGATKSPSTPSQSRSR